MLDTDSAVAAVMAASNPRSKDSFSLKRSKRQVSITVETVDTQTSALPVSSIQYHSQ
jgi:hypothetical protein|tara:strand:+ start:301 stop:471 length:171 start_codon:yes stop_codon:yes gene_type:complete